MADGPKGRVGLVEKENKGRETRAPSLETKGGLVTNE